MKKAFDQTVRDLKREVNKKVLKVPGTEQKILDATSNEPWGPHGSHLADIAQATQNYHEYQMIMQVIWKRINDTGKNWRHVYKALTVLEYLVGHGSERVIDEIKEHAYQISTLSDFQYIDSSGRDQGSNVRRKSQCLVSLVNDKERIQEIRQKALDNRDKYRSTYASGGRQSPYSGSGDYGDRHDEDRYESRYRDEDRNGYGRERDWGNKDDDRYGRVGDSYHRDGDNYGRGSDERYGKDTYKYDDYRGGRGNDDYKFGARKSLDRDRDRSFEDDDRYSSRSGGARADDPSQDDSRRLERKLSEQSVGAPPSYEETMRGSNDRVQDERADGKAAAPATKASSPLPPKAVSPASTSQGPNCSAADASASASNTENDGFDEFDPRGFAPAAPPATNGLGTDLFGKSSASDLFNSLALVPVTSNTASSKADVTANSDFGTNFVALSSASAAFSQPNEDPFGDTPFKATDQENLQPQQQTFAPATAFQPSSSSGQSAPPPPPAAPNVEAPLSFDFGDSLGGLTFTTTVANDQQHFVANPPPMATGFTMAQANSGVHGGFLPTGSSGLVPPQVSQQPTGVTNIPAANMNYPLLSGANMNYPPQSGSNMNYPSQSAANMSYPPQYGANMNYTPLSGAVATFAPQSSVHSVRSLNPQTAPVNHLTGAGLSAQLAPHSASGQPAKDKFETKSTVWSDTLNRGLVNLNISGAKINPLADIGIDFDSINRKEKRNEKISAAPVTSTITMGKAMGSGSGIGRAGAASNPKVGSGMGMGMGMGMGGANGMGMGNAGMGNGMAMGSYNGGMSQQTGMGMGMGMGMNMGMNQGAQMRPPTPGPGMPGFGYNPMAMGMGGYPTQQGGYPTQQPYGGGYR
ncbi:clathrin interactor EPSIN 2 [Iris pallida]|uniref:Clathrin interactor EPSIN 2 n=1 Tax=Iris pallida TaxID=29817 RepID=A0AAX6DL27_IRIPA|nr:clathrin interactor EPSIN 2 [Iris pallida]